MNVRRKADSGNFTRSVPKSLERQDHWLMPETLEMLWRFLGELEIVDIELVLNTLGDDACRVRFREALVAWLSVRIAAFV